MSYLSCISFGCLSVACSSALRSLGPKLQTQQNVCYHCCLNGRIFVLVTFRANLVINALPRPIDSKLSQGIAIDRHQRMQIRCRRRAQ